MHVDLDTLELRSAWLASDPTARWHVSLAVSGATGAESSALVYFKLDAGCRLPRHVDSAEEIMVVLSGSGMSTVGERRLDVRAGQLVRIPQLVPHELRNTGSTSLAAVGFFASAAPTSTFDEPVMPLGGRVRGMRR